MKDMDTQLKITRARIRELETQALQFQNIQQQKDARLQQLERLQTVSKEAHALETSEQRCKALEELALQQSAELRSLREECESLKKEVETLRTGSKPLPRITVNRTKLPQTPPQEPEPIVREGIPPIFDLTRVYTLPNGHRIRVKEQKEGQILIERQSDGKIRWVSAWEFQEGLGSTT